LPSYAAACVDYASSYPSAFTNLIISHSTQIHTPLNQPHWDQPFLPHARRSAAITAVRPVSKQFNPHSASLQSAYCPCSNTQLLAVDLSSLRLRLAWSYDLIAQILPLLLIAISDKLAYGHASSLLKSWSAIKVAYERGIRYMVSQYTLLSCKL